MPFTPVNARVNVSAVFCAEPVGGPGPRAALGWRRTMEPIAPAARPLLQLEENIRVAVRVRPVNEDERQSGQVRLHHRRNLTYQEKPLPCTF